MIPPLTGTPLRRRRALAVGTAVAACALAACASKKDKDEDSPLHDTTLPPSGAASALPSGLPTGPSTPPAPPSETALPLEFSQTATWPQRKNTALIGQLVGRYIVFATSPKNYQERDTYVTGVAAVDGSAGWLLVIDPQTGEVSTVQIPDSGEPELPDPADDEHPGKALDVLSAEFIEEEVYVLVAVGDRPTEDEDTRARIDLLKIELKSGRITGTLGLDEDVSLPIRGWSHVDLMSNGNLSVHPDDVYKPGARVVDPSTMRAVASQARGRETVWLGPEAVKYWDAGQKSPTVLLLTDDKAVALGEREHIEGVYQDWAYIRNAPQEPMIIRNLRTGQEHTMAPPSLGAAGDSLRYTFQDGVLIGQATGEDSWRKEGDREITNGEVLLPGSPTPLVSVEDLTEAHADLPVAFGGLLWAASTDIDGEKKVGLVCFDAATGQRLGTVVADDKYGKPLVIQGISSWGIADRTGFYPATSWATDVEEWQDQKK